MEPAKSASNRSLKEGLLKQAKRCRDELEMLKGLRGNVFNAVDEACSAVDEAIAKAAVAAEGADSAQIKALCKELRFLSKLVRKYETALENILDIEDLEDESDQLPLSVSARDDIGGVRGVSAAASTGPVSTSSVRCPLSPLPFEQTTAAPLIPALSISDLISFPDVEQSLSPSSRGFDTAESCGNSSYADAAGSARPTRASSLNSAIGLELAIAIEGIKSMPSETQAVQAGHDEATGRQENEATIVGTGNQKNEAAVAGQQAGQVTRSPPTAVAQALPITEQENIPMERSEPTRSFSDSVAETTSSPPATDSSSDSAVTIDDEFVEGGVIPCGKFYFSEDDSVRFYMRYIVSPDEFYVQPLSHETCTAHSQLRCDLPQFYDNDENRKPLFQEGAATASIKGKYAVCVRHGYYTDNLELERCEILACREATAASRAHGALRFEVQVRFIDLGNIQWVAPSQIWKIDRRFCKAPALTIRCRLFDTRPKDEGFATAFGLWSDEAISKFKSLCDGDRPMTAHVLNGREPFGLMMYVYRGLTKECLNAALVAERMAKTLTNFNKAAELIAKRGQRGYNVNRDEEAGANLKVDFLCFGAEARPLPPPAVNTTVLVEVQKFSTCCRFSVNFPIGVGDIRQIRADPQARKNYEDPIWRYKTAMDEMNAFYARDTTSVFDQWPLVGQLVASKFSEDERYYRARLLDIAPQDNSARVRYVDYGNDEWVSINSLRPLKPQFVSIPYMAMECFLAGVRPIPRVSATGDNINTMMEEARSRSPQKYLLARIVRVEMRQPPAGPMLSVVLTTEDGSVNFNNYVVEQGWAERE